MERWIEIEAGAYPDGYPKTKYIHEQCEEKSIGSCKSVESCYPYCPYCGRKITNVRVLKNDFEEHSVLFWETRGFICD